MIKEIYLILFLVFSMGCFGVLLIQFTITDDYKGEYKYNPWKDGWLWGTGVFGAIWIFAGLKLIELI